MEKETKIWNSENFCVVFMKPLEYYYDYDNDTSSEDTDNKSVDVDDPYSIFDFTYMTCYEEKISWCEQFINTFHPIILSISTVFLIITLLVYVVYVYDDGLCKINPLFSKITIGFITNLTIFFIVIIDNYSHMRDGERRETFPCILSGYLVLYFSLAFFFWINTMSFNIWMKFTFMSMQSPCNEEGCKKFWKYFAYAQGMPLLITIITAIVDATGNADGNEENLIHHPNMGMYSCFLGAVATPSTPQSYFGRPEFIYYHVFIMLLQIANMFFLGITVHSIYKGWKNEAKMQKHSGK